MEKRKILLPVAILALLISGCSVKKRSQTESQSGSSSTPKTSESSSTGGSQGGSSGGTSQGGTSQPGSESQPGTSESQPGSESQNPLGSGYFVKLGSGQPLEFVDEAEKDAGVEHELKNYHLQVNGVTAGEAIEFSTNAGVINHNIGPNDTANADRTGSEQDGWQFTIHNDVVGNVDIYFKLYDAEEIAMQNQQPHSYSFWISGRESGGGGGSTTDPEQYALIMKGSEQSKAALVTNGGNDAEWTNEQPLVLEENDELAFCLGGDDWRKFDQLKDDIPHKAEYFSRVNAEGDPSDGNIKVSAEGAGSYNVYIVKDKDSNSGKTIYMEKTNTPEPPQPAAKYELKLGEAAAVEMDEVATPGTGLVKQYKKEGLNLAKDTVLQILADDEPLNFDKDLEDAENKCNLYKEAGVWKIHNAAENATIYLNNHDGSTWKIWVTGYVVDPSSLYEVTFNITEDAGEGKAMYVAGDFTNWQTGALKMTEGEGHAWTLTHSLEAGQYEFKFVKASATDGIGEGAIWEQLGTDVNREFEVVDHAVELNLTWENGGSGSSTTDPEQYAFVIRGENQIKAALVTNGGNDAEWTNEQPLVLEENDELAFCLGGDDWRKFDQLKDEVPDKATNFSRVTLSEDPSDGNIKVTAAGAGTYNVYIIKDKTANSGKTVYLAKVSSPEPPQPVTDVEYTITGIPNWAGNDDAVLLVWAWGGTEAGAGKWYAVTWTSGQTTATVTLKSDATNFKVVRMYAETTLENAAWNRVHNEGSTINIVGGTTSYACGLE